MSYLKYQGKNIFYTEIGDGEPCIFLHGNTASSKMFEYLLPLYTDEVKAISIDFWETVNQIVFQSFLMNYGLNKVTRL